MKKVLLLIVLCLMFTLELNVINADANHPSVAGYTMVCEYNQTVHGYQSTSTWDRTDVILLYISDGYYNGAEKYAVASGTKGDSASSFAVSQDLTLSSKNKLTGLGPYKQSGCPKYAYYWGGKYCFDYDGHYCNVSTYSSNNGNTRQGSWVTGSQLVHNVKSELENSIKTIVKSVDDKYSTKGGTVVSPLCNNQIPSYDALTKRINASLDNIMKKYGSASFEASAFKNVTGEIIQKPIEDLKSKIEKYLEDCKKLIQNDSSLSDSERQQQLQELETGTTEAVEDFSSELSSYLKDQMQYDINDDFSGGDGCDGLLGDTSDPNDPAYYARIALLIMRYAGVILCVVLSIIDFFKAIVIQDKDAIKKAAKTATFRLIFAVVIFFLPIVLDFILGLLGDEYKLCIAFFSLF